MCEYKIEILKCDSKVFEQLCELIRKFVIHVYIIQKFDLANESRVKKEEYIYNCEKYLNSEDLKYIKNDIEQRIDFFRNSLKNHNNNLITRHYLLFKENELIGFQTAQLRKNLSSGEMEGLRNYAYIDKKYMGKKGRVMNYCGMVSEGVLMNVVYNNITEWFSKNNVSIERTATGKNMYQNILLYIVDKEFEIDYVDDKKIYFKKIVSKLKPRKERIKLYNEYLKSEKSKSLKY